MADRLITYLSDWVIKYVKNKDILARRLQDIGADGDIVRAKFEHKEHDYVIIPEIRDINIMLNRLSVIKARHLTLVILNNQHNLDLIARNWHAFLDLGQNFSVLFVNPFSKTEKIWIIAPYIHHKISDEASLELGLRAMSENVEPITREEAEKIIT